jgi:hypothetical protein
MNPMRIIETSDRQLAHKARLAQFRGVISAFEFEGEMVTGVVQAITEQRLDDGIRWKITIRRKSERVATGLRRYSPRF